SSGGQTEMNLSAFAFDKGCLGLQRAATSGNGEERRPREMEKSGDLGKWRRAATSGNVVLDRHAVSPPVTCTSITTSRTLKNSKYGGGIGGNNFRFLLLRNFTLA
ncbi:MAG: hypothetical protein ACREEM_42045, partial [Blastocatellia bacterium]